MTSGLDKPEVDFLVLADHAEVVGGKLYMMGGGWDVRRIEDFSKPFNMNIAVGVLTPWALANKENQVPINHRGRGREEAGSYGGRKLHGGQALQRYRRPDVQDHGHRRSAGDAAKTRHVPGSCLRQKPCGLRRRRQVNHLCCRRKKSGSLRTSHSSQLHKHLAGPVSVSWESQRVPRLRREPDDSLMLNWSE